ncbi:hypothetical protein [Pseudomonas atacamensis]|uniref:hypothetical protein n=1 Tax=Pseudomonas atacamensis TaxID=2565368 RepID=UPI0019D2CD9A|nr:hypothetical protein [Pseudomonas atacamensis]QSL85981.1 hypothetical protein JWU58_17555 [Pseudomonas atacamensis]
MKDKVNWVVCVLLFFSGVIWGRLFTQDDFYKVSNIHDMFDIFGAAATVGAVVLAMFSLNSWRKQGKAESDHELARKVVVELRRYQEELVRTWSYAESSVAQIQNDTWIGDGGPDNSLVGIYESRLKEAKDARSALAAIEIETSELWGGIFEEQFIRIFHLDHLFCSFIETYLRLLIRGTFDDQSESISIECLRRWEKLQGEGLKDFDSAKSYISEAISMLKDEARNKLLE